MVLLWNDTDCSIILEVTRSSNKSDSGLWSCTHESRLIEWRIELKAGDSIAYQLPLYEAGLLNV
jgi:hypothetical protein